MSYIQNTFQKKGKIYFVGMVAPDKWTINMHIYKYFDRDKVHWMDAIARDLQLHVPRLDVALRNEIARGVRDVYLPNNTHWGPNGHRTVAQALLKYLNRKGILAPTP